MEKPFFSIILPVRDSETTLPWALDSVVKQRFTDWELACVDDFSTDESYRLLVRRAAQDERIRVIKSESKGIVGALNTGLSHATGMWTVRVDSDDICHPDLLSELHQNIENRPEATVHGAQVRYFPRLSLQEGLRAYERWINGLMSHEDIVRNMFVECPMPHPTLTCRRDVLTSLGGYRDMGWPEDYDLVLRLWLKEARFSKVGKELYFWRDTHDRLSRTHPMYSIEKFMEAKIEFLLASHLSERGDVVVAGAGPVGKSFARNLMKRGVTIAAFLEVNPSKIGKTIYGAAVRPVEEAPRFRGITILHAVGQKYTREEARKLYKKLGLTELEDFLVVS